MRTRYKITDNDQVYFITSTIIEWLPIFTKKIYFDIIIESLSYCRQNKGLIIFAYVIMDNHIHLIVAGDNLASIIKDFKRHTARKIIEKAREDNKDWLLNQFTYFRQKYKKESDYQVWQEGIHPKQIISEEMLRQKIEYIHYNPVRNGIVDKAEEWIYSSAKNYLGLESVMGVDVLEI